MRLLIFLLIGTYALHAQETKALDCIYLIKSLEFNELQSHFLISKITETDLIVIDSANYFRNCNCPRICDHEVHTSNVWPKGLDVNDYQGKKFNNLIVLFRADEIGKDVFLYFWEPNSNSAVELRLRKRGKRVIIKVISSGQY